VAQCLIESNWLKSAPGFNCFGIKSTDRQAESQYCVTQEFIDGTWVTCHQKFAVYPNLTACFADHGNLLMGGYGRNCYSTAVDVYRTGHDLDAFIRAVCAKYATDPGYAALVLTLAHGPNVTAAIARAYLPPPDLPEAA
jgi:flagellar protein FlgJ